MRATSATTRAGGLLAALVLSLARCDAPPTECIGECSAEEQQQGPHCRQDFALEAASITCPVDSHGCHYEVRTHCNSGFCEPTSGLCATRVDCSSTSSCDGCIALGVKCSRSEEHTSELQSPDHL